MSLGPGKRKSGGMSLYDDDDDDVGTEKPPLKRTSTGLYDAGDIAEGATTTTENSKSSSNGKVSKIGDGEMGGGVSKNHQDNASGSVKDLSKAESPLLISVLGCRRGERDDMQDAHLLIDDLSLGLPFVKRCALYAIFDGHAGTKAASYCEEHIPAILKKKLSSYTDLNTMEKQLKRTFTETFKSVDDGFLLEARKMKPVWKDGTTVTCVLLLNDSLYVANLGDSKAIVCRAKEEGFSSIELTVNHNPTMYEERMRIQKAGGTVRDGRVNGIIEVSRSIGDGQFKTHGVTCMPDMKKLTITENDR
ncbi:unnamed protein product [Nippostrongylus brasiliensis]|uniref:PPM-type phosphatase domain-containing protein n=1 Tax=Nippostrongylus brasiliensis TaxID=27835 RepID=A0A158R009_NIPBR|nr:hypothetical protein Q1695_012523 [Nippostrongylus brasiliensis]VDL74607.1 unnamed protein product [Nippostrongylus brasiliensis]